MADITEPLSVEVELAALDLRYARRATGSAVVILAAAQQGAPAA